MESKDFSAILSSVEKEVVLLRQAAQDRGSDYLSERLTTLTRILLDVRAAVERGVMGVI